MLKISELTTKAYVSASNAIYNFKKNQKGVTAIEYGLIAVAVAALIVAVFYGDNSFLGALKSKFNSLKETVSGTKVS